MNILVINLDKAIFEKDSSSLRRLKEYSRLVDKIFVIVWTRKKGESISFEDKLFIYPTNSKFKILYFIQSFFLACRIAKKDKIDLIFTQDPFETGLAGWIVSKIKKVPLQIQVHTDFLSSFFEQESFFNKIRVILANFLIPRAHSLRVVSERIKKSIITNYKLPITKIFVLPIFVDLKKIQDMPVNTDLRKKYPQFGFIILMASRFSKEKNIYLAIDAIKEVNKKYPKASLIIVGNGPEEDKLRSQVMSHKLQDNIKFESWTDNIISYYKTADLFLLTSNYEGYGMSVIEAMAAGCPVVMTDVGCAGEVVKDRHNGIVIPVGDKEKLIDSIIKLIEDGERRKRLGKYASESVYNYKDKNEYLENYKKSWEAARL